MPQHKMLRNKRCLPEPILPLSEGKFCEPGSGVLQAHQQASLLILDKIMQMNELIHYKQCTYHSGMPPSLHHVHHQSLLCFWVPMTSSQLQKRKIKSELLASADLCKSSSAASRKLTVYFTVWAIRILVSKVSYVD